MLAPLIFFVLTFAQNPEKCYLAVLEGGGPRGAYEVGALLAITEFLPANEVEYQVISGVSTGAINSCLSLGFPLGQERAMALYMQKVWMSIKNYSILYSPWWGLYTKGGLINTENMYRFIEENSGKVINRVINVAATNYDTGDYANFNTNVEINILKRACYASGAYSPFFPPVNLLGEWYGDGAMTLSSNPFEPIQYCKNKGYEESDIVLDILYDLPVNPTIGTMANNTKEMILQIYLVNVYFTRQWHILSLEKFYPNVDLRFFVKPEKNYGAIQINSKHTEFLINTGYNDTKALIFMSKAERSLKYKENMWRALKDLK